MLNRFLISALLICTTFIVNSQTSEHRNQIGLSIGATDFSGPITSRFFEFDNYHGVGRVHYSRYLNPSFNVKLDFSALKALHPKETVYPDIESDIYTLEDFYDAGLKIEYKLDNGYIFKENAVVGPYLTAGLGANYLGGNETPQDWNSFVPLGLGFNIRPAKKITINIQGEYKLNLDNSFDYTQFSAGLGYNFGKRSTPDVLIVDTDNDGIPDETDECPFAYGIIDYFGCPDSDGDGIGDSRDKCPFDAGKLDKKGCPIVDMDDDGVEDSKDECPDVAGKKALKGCPDTDNDGVADHLDDCPKQAGIAENNGCPEATEPKLKETYSIYFREGFSKVDSDQEETLDEVTAVMKKNENITIKIKGYTSSNGDTKVNMQLSLKRAENTWNYLVKNGIGGSRMSIFGYGEFDPKYDNSDPNQIKKNRRVDIEIFR